MDAAVAASLVSWVAESPLTGPGAGGFMLVHRARDHSTRVYDFFVSVAGLGLEQRDVVDMDRVDVDFSGGSTQVFHIGAASCAVPGVAIGLEEAHRSFGLLPWRDLFAPAIDLARNGVELNKGQAYLHAILDLDPAATRPESRAVYERNGERLVAEDTDSGGPRQHARADCGKGGRVPYEGELAEQITDHPRARRLHHPRGRRATGSSDARPVRAASAARSTSQSPPSAGGILTPTASRYWRNSAPENRVKPRHRRLARVMREQANARIAAGSVTGLARALETRAAVVSQGTTHISVVDGTGNAVALTTSTGAGSGVIVPGTGIHLNNMTGEFDLAKPPRAGARLSSMMSPSVVLREGRPHLVVGSAGSLRCAAR